MADGHAFSVTRIWILLDTSDDMARVTHVFGVDEHLPPDAVPLYQGHQIASRLRTQARVWVSRVMKNPEVKNPKVGKDIFRVMCGDGRQLLEQNCGEPSKSRDAWSWVTARLL